MHIPDLSDPTLAELHANIRLCLHRDDHAPRGRDWEYGVRTYPDWAIQRDKFETELERRAIPYVPIVW